MRDEGTPAAQPWEIHSPPAESPLEPLDSGLELHPLVVDILRRRGVESPEAARRFLSPSLEHLHDPFGLLGMDAAVERITESLESGERIVISGDYDVDGITSSALLADFLGRAGCADLEIFIPNRFKHGYGLTPRTVEALLELKPGLVVTVDNGITALDEVAQLQQAGVGTIITDHHLPRPEGVPPGIVINPRNPACGYPFKGISGCGVAFKLVTALRKSLRERGWWGGERKEPNLKRLLDLVAIGTVADVVPLLDENRVLVYHGLAVLNRGVNRPGVAALLANCRVTGEITARTIGYQIAPRINAAGRMKEGALGVKLLLANELGQAEELAGELEQNNRNRRAKGDEMLEEAHRLIKEEGLVGDGALVVASPTFHEGIIGIIAARLAESHGVPAAVLAVSGDHYKGSARSIPTVNVSEALAAGSEQLLEYGGHAGAAGFLLLREKLQPFREAFNRACGEQMGESGIQPLMLDGKLDAETPYQELVEQIGRLEPFGHQNDEPVFLLEQSALPEPPQVMAGKHLKWHLSRGVDLIAWNQAGSLPSSEGLKFMVRLGFNEYRGTRSVQVTVEKILKAP